MVARLIEVVNFMLKRLDGRSGLGFAWVGCLEYIEEGLKDVWMSNEMGVGSGYLYVNMFIVPHKMGDFRSLLVVKCYSSTPWFAMYNWAETLITTHGTNEFDRSLSHMALWKLDVTVLTLVAMSRPCYCGSGHVAILKFMTWPRSCPYFQLDVTDDEWDRGLRSRFWVLETMQAVPVLKGKSISKFSVKTWLTLIPEAWIVKGRCIEDWNTVSETAMVLGDVPMSMVSWITVHARIRLNL